MVPFQIFVNYMCIIETILQNFLSKFSILDQIVVFLFFEQVFVAGVNAKFLYVGEDFQFGYRKQGDVALLKEEGKKNDISVSGIPLIQDHVNDDGPISSTAIRKNIENGEILLANKKLGRMFELQGKVVAGDGRGKSIGFPTANLAVSEEIMVPREGVYAVWYEKEDGSRDYEEKWTGDYVFENEWQSFRTKENRKLDLVSAEKEIIKSTTKLAVKVIDIFGNDLLCCLGN